MRRYVSYWRWMRSQGTPTATALETIGVGFEGIDFDDNATEDYRDHPSANARSTADA